MINFGGFHHLNSVYEYFSLFFFVFSSIISIIVLILFNFQILGLELILTKEKSYEWNIGIMNLIIEIQLTSTSLS